MNGIRVLKRKEIDTLKWDNCITHSINSLPYAYCWYLDAVAENWEALVEGDYEHVMPLVWIRKWGIKCLYQPYYCQQLGVFGEELKPDVVLEFMHHINRSFPYIHINLHSSSLCVAEKFVCRKKSNYILDLDAEYPLLVKKYSDNHKRNIRKASQWEPVFSEETPLNKFQQFYIGNIKPDREIFKPQHKDSFLRLTNLLIKNKSGKIYSVEDRDGNLLASAMIVFHKNRIINLINTSSDKGKKAGASHYLFDRLLARFSGKAAVFDFEGSSIPGIARFYEGFGASNVPFYLYSTNLVKNLRQRFS